MIYSEEKERLNLIQKDIYAVDISKLSDIEMKKWEFEVGKLGTLLIEESKRIRGEIK